MRVLIDFIKRENFYRIKKKIFIKFLFDKDKQFRKMKDF